MNRRWCPLLAATGVAMLALPVAPASAAPVPGSSTTAVRQVCPAPKQAGEMKCFALARTDVTPHKGLSQLAPGGYGPADLSSAYALPSGTGGIGQTVAVVDAFDDPSAEADLAVYRAQFGLPPCTTDNGCFRKANQTGTASPLPVPQKDWAGEISLDLDMVSATCPNCHILLVEADSNVTVDLFTAVDTAISMGARFVSNSYGSSEYPGQLQDESVLDRPGVAITASTGDLGYGTSFPASSRFVTAVGGTSLTRSAGDRGWAESAWSGAGSGCSAYEPKPSMQTDPGCPNRSNADVSAVADPATGVAVYNSFSDSGWTIYGGTSVSAPIIAATYALAGPPAADTYANTYPYAGSDALNDVTTGSNGTCEMTYLCTAGPGYDGPTGLGTPNGVRAFAPAGPHGEVTGTVTDSTGHPVTGAAVSAGPGSPGDTTDAQGRYTLALTAGSHDLTVAAYGYRGVGPTTVMIPDGGTVTRDFTLVRVPSKTVSGRVRDASGHGWGLYAKISINGVPGGPVYTDPMTGRYKLSLADGASYTMHVTAMYPGYVAVDQKVTISGADQKLDISVAVDVLASCVAPGYTNKVAGLRESFDKPATPAGWSVTTAQGGGWGFTDKGQRGNHTGGSGGFAMIDAANLGGDDQDTELRTPVVDLTGVRAPAIEFHTDLVDFGPVVADVDLSLDGGTTWSNVRRYTDSVPGPRLESIAIPQAASKARVQVRFHYVSHGALWWWELDDVVVGTRTCQTVPGGLVAGHTLDRNTGAGLNGVRVRSVSKPADAATSTATQDDPGLGDGFYWLFSSKTDTHRFTASRGRYAAATSTLKVAANSVTRANFSLAAAKLAATPGNLTATVTMGNRASRKLTIRNTGTVPATVTLGERDSGTPASTAAAARWTSIADLPSPVAGNMVGADRGRIYSVGGGARTVITGRGYAYDPLVGAWSPIASLHTPREVAASAFINGRFYVAGGWDSADRPLASLEIYNPDTDTWSTGASMPAGFGGAGSTVLNGKLYVVGGCDDDTRICAHKEVYAYTPATDTWMRVADYPQAAGFISCGGLAGELICAGGLSYPFSSKQTYAYSPATNTWSALPDLPIGLSAAASAVANGRLLISGGFTDLPHRLMTQTKQGYAFDPTAGAWRALPDSVNAVSYTSGACGFVKVGGQDINNNNTTHAEVLPGYDHCAEQTDVTWLSENRSKVTVAPGASVTVTITMNSRTGQVTHPGDYTAEVTLTTSTPYPLASVAVTMTVRPPKR